MRAICVSVLVILTLCGCNTDGSNVTNSEHIKQNSQDGGVMSVPRVLPGELTAEEILDGKYRFPPSPESPVKEVWDGFAKDRLTAVPKPGVHPRLLIGPDDLPDLRRRLKETETGKVLFKRLETRIDETLHKAGSYHTELYQKLASGDTEGAKALIRKEGKLPDGVGHYQPFLYTIAMESLYAMIVEDEGRGKKAATATATYSQIIEPVLDNIRRQPLSDDVWRARSAKDLESWAAGKSVGDMVGYHLLGYAYDFSYNYMTTEQRDVTRRVISKATKDRIWMGAQLPHHWRNWNWVAVGLCQPLLSLAIEGEEGYDPRVYRFGVEIARDYLTYGMSPSGSSTEAVGYTQFGLVWGTPLFVAASRRGDNLLVHSHHRAMVDWYVHSMEPYAAVWAQQAGPVGSYERDIPPMWTSHGDGGDSGPSIWHMMMWRYFFPDDPKVDFVWQAMLRDKNLLAGKYHIIEPLIWATDGRKTADNGPVDYRGGAELKEPLKFFDPIRSSLNVRSAWSPDAAAMQFECRTDSVSASHEHADRGSFTFSALGRQWAKESFRSVETRHHNNILIDGMGQGYWPGPGKWLGMQDGGWAVIAACDAKEAYDWWWPKTIVTDTLDAPRFKYERWVSYLKEAQKWRWVYGGQSAHRDTRSSVEAFFKGYEVGDPRMWDEDGWPLRLVHNPVRKAFRTVVFVRTPVPYLLVIDDIKKDGTERLYEWIMMTGPDTDIAKIQSDDIVLCDAATRRDNNGMVTPQKGDRQLLVRILDSAIPANPHDIQSRPAARLETFEKKDSFVDGRSFGRDRRFVIPSRSVEPDFKILLFPHRQDEALPVTTWNADHTALTIEAGGKKSEIQFKRGEDGRTRLTLTQDGQDRIQLN
jgi:hypothetical protein